MNYRRIIWSVITHALVAVVMFIVSFYGFGFFAISDAINKCGTDTEYTIAQNVTGERVEGLDSVCDWTSPGHNVRIYRAIAGRTEPKAVAFYSANTFLLPRATWRPQGQLVIELPHVKHLSTGTDSNVTIKFGSVL